MRQIPGVLFDLPGKPSDGYWMDMGRRDLVHLCETLMHSDVVANVTSTIVVDAAFFDTPSICIGYGYTHPKTHFEFADAILRNGSFPVRHRRRCDEGRRQPGCASGGIDRYLLNPSLDRAGRARITRRISHFDDGCSSRRTANAILKMARAAESLTASHEARNKAETPAHGRAT